MYFSTDNVALVLGSISCYLRHFISFFLPPLLLLLMMMIIMMVMYSSLIPSLLLSLLLPGLLRKFGHDPHGCLRARLSLSVFSSLASFATTHPEKLHRAVTGVHIADQVQPRRRHSSAAAPSLFESVRPKCESPGL